MSSKLSLEESKQLIGLSGIALDSVALHFLKTSQCITIDDFSNLVKSIIKEKKSHDFSLIEEFGPVKIGILRFNNHYFECFKETGLFPYEGSIIFYAEAFLPTCKECLVWPLLSDCIYMLNPQTAVCQGTLASFYEQTVELDQKTMVFERNHKHYVQKISFSRVYKTSRRKFWMFAIKKVKVVSDLVIQTGWYSENPSEVFILKRQPEAPMWLIRHQDEVEFCNPENPVSTR